MCKTSVRAQESGTFPRPQWGALYALALLMLGALAAAEILGSPGRVETVLECGLTLAGFGAIALWRRGNRAALDQQEWCNCAGRSVTMRVIPSRRPLPVRMAAMPQPRPRIAVAGSTKIVTTSTS